MSLPPKPRYAIVATDLHPGVRVGAHVVYSLVRTNVITASGGSDARVAETAAAVAAEYTLGHPYTQDDVVAPRVRWALLPERSLHLEPVGETDGFGRGFEAGRYDVSVTWAREGVHRIKCFIETPPPWKHEIQVATFKQQVRSAGVDARISESHWWLATIAGDQEPRAQTISATTPERAATEMFRGIEVADELEALHPTQNRDAKWTYQRNRELQIAHAQRTYDLSLRLDPGEHRRHAITALHVTSVDNIDLVLFVAFGRRPRVSRTDEVGEPALARVRIVDWTDASNEAYSGVYAGGGKTTAHALAGALLRWKDENHYAEGEVRFELPAEVAEVLGDAAQGGRLSPRIIARLSSEVGIDLASFTSGLPLQGRFETHAPVDVAAVLDHVALASALVATAVMFAAPVPGSRAVAALLWTSAVAGAAASTVRIATRHERGISDPTATAIDVLGIVSSFMMLPGAAAVWRRGASIAVREALVHGTGQKVLKMSLVGQIGADGLQGVLIAADASKQLRALLENDRESPTDRLEKAATLIAQLVATGALVVVGAHGNLDDIAKLETKPGKLRRFGEEGEEIDLGDGEGSAGDTRKGKHLDEADVEPPLDPRLVKPEPELTPASRAALGELDDAAKAKARVMLDADEIGANLLFTRFGREALDVADELATVWRRWGEYDLPASWLRMVHDHTGLLGVRYFAKLPDGEASRLEYAAGGWACERETYFRSIYPPAGHSVARHGPHLPDGKGGALEHRVTDGYAAEMAEHVQPDGTKRWERVAAPSRRSSRFLSFVDWNDAHDTAYLTLEQQFKAEGVDRLHGPIPATKGDPFPKASGYIKFLDVDDPTKKISRSLGEGYEGAENGKEPSVTFRRPNGSTFKKKIYPIADPVPADDITYVFTTMGWTGSEWILINLYPSALPKASTFVGLTKASAAGASTI